MISDKVKDFFTKNIGYLAVALISVLYVLTAFVRIENTGKSVSEILSGGALSFLFGVCLNRFFELQGMLQGERDERLTATVKLHGTVVDEITPYIDRLDDWCRTKNQENYRTERTKILARVGIHYEDVFDVDGVAKKFLVLPEREKSKSAVVSFFTKLFVPSKRYTAEEKEKARAVKRAVKLKLTPLNAGMLTSESGKNADKYNFGRTKTEYKTEKGVADAVTKLATALIFGYFGVRLISDFSYASLIWTMLQVAVFLVMGVIKMMSAHMYMTDEYRGRLIQKIDCLQKFKNEIETEKESLKNGKENC